MICGRESAGVGKSSPLLAGSSPPLPGGRAPGGPRDECSPLPWGLDPVHFVPDGFLDGRASAVENVAGHLPCGRLPDAAEAVLALFALRHRTLWPCQRWGTWLTCDKPATSAHLGKAHQQARCARRVASW